MTAPAFVYLGMGLVVARILLDKTQTRGMTWLQWLQYLVDALRIVLLWPLVLFVEKVSAWLKAAPEEQPISVNLFTEEHFDSIPQVETVRGEEP